MSWVGDWCSSGRPVVVVGDFNATTDNLASTPAASCTDAATTHGKERRGTWPASIPAFLGLPIDHVLVAGAGVSVTDFDVLTSEDASGARHRPVVATIRY